MSTAMTAAGESLVARLQAEGKPLVIDRMIFAHIPGQDHTQPIAPGVTVPVDAVKHTFAIPPEYRAYVNPNQVVYSALLGSDVGDFTFNWQGLYCSAHDVLVAVATFPALEKRKYDVATGKTGNNLTRNFLLTFTGAREITGLTISADVWQLDFTVRLKGMDERTRLANFDLYGQGYFEGDGWLLKENAGNYSFTPGLGYVGGIRAMLEEPLPLAVRDLPSDVYLSVCLRPVGSDRVAEASPVQVPVGTVVTDTEDETGLVHYRQIVARIEADCSVTDLRPKRMGGLPPEKVGAADRNVRIIAGRGLAGGGPLTGDVTLRVDEDAIKTVRRGMVAPYYKVTFGGSDGRRPIFWGEATADEGYVLCDGGSDGAGGTVPDLRDRMIMGAGNTYAAGNTGGATTHSHSVSGSVGGTTLGVNQMPSHGHGGGNAVVMGQGGSQYSYVMGNYSQSLQNMTISGSNAGGSGSHSHSLSASTNEANGLPPYYTLAYVIKI